MYWKGRAVRKVKYFFISLLIGLLTWTFKNIISESFYLECWLYIFFVLLIILTWLGFTRKFFTPNLIVILIMIAYFSGQIFLYALNLRYKNFDIFLYYSKQQVSDALWYTVTFILFYLLGSLFFYKEVEKNFSSIEDKSYLIASKFVGWMLFFISMPGYLYNLFMKLYTSLIYGYGSLYDEGSSIEAFNLPILGSINFLFIPSVLLLLVVYKNHKFFKTILILLVFLIIGTFFISGLRGSALTIFIVFIYLYLQSIANVTSFKKTAIGLIGSVLLLLIPVINSIRNMPNKNLNEVLNVATESLMKENIFVMIFGELGGTMRVLLASQELVPNTYSFFLGETYFASITSFIPSSLMFGFERISLPEWLKSALNMNYGPGFSLIGESYVNFGPYGFFVALILGAFFSLLFSKRSKNSDNNVMMTAYIAMSLYFVLLVIRDQILLLIRYEVYCVILVILLIKVLRSIIKKTKSST